MKRFLLWLVLLSGACLAGWVARGMQTSRAGKDQAPDVETVRVMRGTLQQQMKSRGIVKPAPNALVRVGFPMPKDVARRIRSLTLVEGDEVQAGQVLAKLDDADLAASLRQLQSEAAVFQERLDSAKTLEVVETRVADAQIAAAEAKANHARRVYERLDKIADKKSIPALEWETAQTDVEVSRAALTQAKAQLEQIKAKFRTDIAVLAAQVEQSTAAQEYLQVQRQWGELQSPISGQVLSVHQHQGELTSNNPGVPVLTLLDPRQLQLHLYVDESDFGRVRVGQPVTFRVDAHPGETLRGEIVRLLPQPILQENVVYYLAVVEVTAEQRSLLLPEMTALAQIEAGKKEDVLTLPLQAVRSGAGGWTVLQPNGAQPKETPVQIGWKESGRVEIVSGLNEGDEVIIEP